MSFDISRYTITNKRSLWRAIRLKWILHKRKCLRLHKETELKEKANDQQINDDFSSFIPGLIFICIFYVLFFNLRYSYYLSENPNNIIVYDKFKGIFKCETITL